MMDAAIVLIEGTNCEDESKLAFEKVGIAAEKVHLKQFTGDCAKDRGRRISDFEILFFPGGWSAGDYVRAGAIFAARLKSKLGGEISEFVSEGRLVGGVCNGFQILTELGLLPGFNGLSEVPEGVLTINASSRFQCRPVYLKHESSCDFTGKIKKKQVLQIPVAHAEGRLSFGIKNDEDLKILEDNDQIVFRYCMPDGKDAEGKFPWNPNGSIADIAGICNPEGNVLGMMPHPERVMEKIQQADWTRSGPKGPGDGRIFFESIAGYLKKKR
ncbi:MAG: phosphoribosylformylglycinamidine synthase subunit PurQ [Methanobacteriota archaeon]